MTTKYVHIHFSLSLLLVVGVGQECNREELQCSGKTKTSHDSDNFEYI